MGRDGGGGKAAADGGTVAGGEEEREGLGAEISGEGFTLNFLKTVCALAVLIVSSTAEAAQSPVPGRPRVPSAESTASLIGALPELLQLQKIATGSTSADRWEILSLHQQISEQITAASFQVDAAIAQIDNETARANEVRSYLSDRRDRTVNRANLLSVITGGGLGATSSGLQLSSTLTRPAAGVGIGGGAAAASLAAWDSRSERQKQPLRFRIEYAG